MNQSRFNEVGTYLTPKAMWKKHESIDKLFQKKYKNKE
jgi:hypothetical protein